MSNQDNPRQLSETSGEEELIENLDMSSHPILLLIMAVGVLWVARMLMNIAFKIVLVFAVVGGAAIAGGSRLPEGISIDTLLGGMSSGFLQSMELGRVIFQHQNLDDNNLIGKK